MPLWNPPMLGLMFKIAYLIHFCSIFRICNSLEETMQKHTQGGTQYTYVILVDFQFLRILIFHNTVLAQKVKMFRDYGKKISEGVIRY